MVDMLEEKIRTVDMLFDTKTSNLL